MQSNEKKSQNPIEIDPGLRTKDAAVFLGFSKPMLVAMRLRGEGPPYYKPSKRLCLYPLSGLIEWREKLMVRPSRETG